MLQSARRAPKLNNGEKATTIAPSRQLRILNDDDETSESDSVQSEELSPYSMSDSVEDISDKDYASETDLEA